MFNVIKSLKLTNFRNYKSLFLDDIDFLNVFVGPNAVGKTNIIEAIQLMTELSSFRHSFTPDLINKTQEKKDNNNEIFARLETEFEQKFLEKTNLNPIKNTLSLVIKNKSKQYKLNAKNKTISNIKGHFPSVTFTPDDLMMVKGGNSLRRGAIDSLGSQLSSSYYTVRKDFSKVLRQKNKLLKDKKNNLFDITLQSIDDVLVISGTQLILFRVALLKKLEPLLNKYYKQISNSQKTNETVQLRYLVSWDKHDLETSDKMENFSFDLSLDQKNLLIKDLTKEEIHQTLKEKLQLVKQEEINKTRTIIGPHADNIEVYLDGKNASTFASQGQQRSIVLAFKLAQVQLIEDVLGFRPILLLDDVMSELDKNRRDQLLNFINNQMQVFITTTNLEYFSPEILKKIKVYNLPLD